VCKESKSTPRPKPTTTSPPPHQSSTFSVLHPNSLYDHLCTWMRQHFRPPTPMPNSQEFTAIPAPMFAVLEPAREVRDTAQAKTQATQGCCKMCSTPRHELHPRHLSHSTHRAIYRHRALLQGREWCGNLIVVPRRSCPLWNSLRHAFLIEVTVWLVVIWRQ